MAQPAPAYLVLGDDGPKVDAWRARVRERAEAEDGQGALRTFDAASDGPGEVAAALGELSLLGTTRYLLVDGVEAWRPPALEPLTAELARMPPDTVLVMVVRAGKPPAGLADAVKKAGGEVREYSGPKPWELPRWAIARAADLGLRLDLDAARALVEATGGGAQRVARELEKLALAVHPREEATAEDVEEVVASETSAEAHDLADALIAGDRSGAFAIAVALRAREDRMTRLVFPMLRRLREAHAAALMLEGGAADKEVARSLRLPPWAAKKVLARARKVDLDALERALCALADMEVQSRGGGVDEDTAFTVALARAAA